MLHLRFEITCQLANSFIYVWNIILFYEKLCEHSWKGKCGSQNLHEKLDLVLKPNIESGQENSYWGKKSKAYSYCQIECYWK